MDDDDDSGGGGGVGGSGGCDCGAGDADPILYSVVVGGAVVDCVPTTVGDKLRAPELLTHVHSGAVRKRIVMQTRDCVRVGLLVRSGTD